MFRTYGIPSCLDVHNSEYVQSLRCFGKPATTDVKSYLKLRKSVRPDLWNIWCFIGRGNETNTLISKILGFVNVLLI